MSPKMSSVHYFRAFLAEHCNLHCKVLCLSVSSVTRVYCDKTNEATGLRGFTENSNMSERLAW